jgi:hypothetical protein
MELLVRELVATSFNRARAHAATCSAATEQRMERSPTNTPSLAPASGIQRPSIPSNRPSVSGSRSTSAAPRAAAVPRTRIILPTPANRLSVWSSSTDDTSCASSVRYSASSLGQSSRESPVETVATPGDITTTTTLSGPVPTRITTLVLPQKRRRTLQDQEREAQAAKQRDSAVADMGCPTCFSDFVNSGLCQCPSNGVVEVGAWNTHDINMGLDGPLWDFEGGAM